MSKTSERFISFVVYGRAATQGSKIAVAKGIVRDANPKTKEWRSKVSQAAGHEMEQRNLKPFRGAICLHLEFIFTRPKTHFGTGKNAAVLKESAPKFHAQTPDRDKLTRAVCDGLKGVVYMDDAQVCDGSTRKYWGDMAMCVVVVEPLEEEI